MLSALIYLLLMQPSVRKTKIATSKESFIEEFIIFRKVKISLNCCYETLFVIEMFVQENFDMRQLEEEESRELYPKQPFLICLGTLHQPTSYNLVVDNFVIPCGEKIEHAFKVLYCAFHAFHLVFPKKLNTFYKFFDGIIFQVNTKIIPT